MKVVKDKRAVTDSRICSWINILTAGRKCEIRSRYINVFYAIMIIPVALLITAMADQDDRKNTDPKIELESFQIADGFEVTLFAAEPLVRKPIQMNWDTEGRLWVVSSTAYPHEKTGEEANDKIYVLEDTDGDGKADKSTVFAEGLVTPTGILPGDGGVYVANSTEILHLTDTNGDGKSDKKRVVLSGFGTADAHHLIHTFRWGPEALLYFNQSIYIYSNVETPSGTKRLEGGGVWQLRPETLELNVYAKGLINPWGLQFDRWGQSFLTDGAGGEGINYAFPGATFVTSPGAERIIRGLNPGQPKHCGLEVISGRHLPESWKGSVITNDFRANRVNRFMLEEQGSGYASKQVEDLLWTDDVAFRPVDISIGPDGAIYVADWYNPIIQHGEVDFYDPRRDHEHGRIWRIVARDRPLVKTPLLGKSSVKELLEALKLPEDWTRSQAKLELKSRGVNAVIQELKLWITGLDKKDPDYEHHLLEALWVHQSLDVVNEQLLLSLLNADSHNARAAAVRVLQFWTGKIAHATDLLTKAVNDSHPRVRLEAVIALRKIQTPEAARIALSVLEYPMDEFLDFALWQTLREHEPLIMKRLKAEPDFFGSARKTAFALKSMGNPDAIQPLMRLYQQGQVPEAYHKDILHSVANRGTVADLNTLFDKAVQDHANKRDGVVAQLAALEEAARRRDIKPDKNATRITSFFVSDEAITIHSINLIGHWGMEELSEHLISGIQKGSKNIRRAALGALVALNNDKTEKFLIDLSSGKNTAIELRLLSAAHLVSLNVSEAARIAVEILQRLPANEDAGELFKAFLSHKQGPRVLAEALTAKKIPEDIAKAVRPTFERQIPWGQHKSENVQLLIKALEASGGFLPAERMPQKLSDREINALAIEIKGTADHNLGEGVFRKVNCASCHAIGGAGGLMGPDLSSLGTSSSVEAIIRSILFPAQSIKEGYELQRMTKKDGSVMMAYMVSNGTSEIVMRNFSGAEVTFAKSEIESVEKTPGSLMPPGLTGGLEKGEFMNLVAFLSKLGSESGNLRVPNARFVRVWRTASANKELAENVNDSGLSYVVSGNAGRYFQPVYSKVSGSLPLEDLSVINVNSNKKYSLLKFKVEVLSAGNVALLFSVTEGITAWVGQETIKLSEEVIVDLPIGVHEITLAIDRNVHEGGSLNIQLEEADHSPAQTRLVLGQ